MTQPATAESAAEEGYYVTAIRGSRTALVHGPHASKEEADRREPAARKLAQALDPRACFDAFGVTRVRGDDLPAGKLNHLLPYRPYTIWHDGELHGDYATEQDREAALSEVRSLGGQVELCDWDTERPEGPGWNDRYPAPAGDARQDDAATGPGEVHLDLGGIAVALSAAIPSDADLGIARDAQ